MCIVGESNYYPFGMTMPGRNYTATTGSATPYRYGFNGKEKDLETTGTTTYDYGFRIYNPALGKFLSVDPLTKNYSMLTPYQFASNIPISGVDLDGLEWFYSADGSLIAKYGDDATIKIASNKRQELEVLFSIRLANKDPNNKTGLKSLAASMTGFRDAELKVRNKIVTQLYRTNINSKSKVTLSAEPAIGVNSGSTKEDESNININPNAGENGEWLANNAYNILTTLVHEEGHRATPQKDEKTFGKHFEIHLKAVNSKFFKFTTANKKNYDKAISESYINGNPPGDYSMEEQLEKYIKNDGTGNLKDNINKEGYELYYNKYKKHIEQHNKTFELKGVNAVKVRTNKEISQAHKGKVK